MEISKYIETYERELKLIRYSQNTIKSYLSLIRIFLLYFNKPSPKHINEDDIKSYLSTINSKSLLKQNIGAIKLFYTIVIKQPKKLYIKYPRKDSVIKSIPVKSDILSLISVINNSKHKAIIYLLYANGLRISEVLNLKITDINSKNNTIKISLSKGNKDRIVPLSPIVLDLLRIYFKE